MKEVIHYAPSCYSCKYCRIMLYQCHNPIVIAEEDIVEEGCIIKYDNPDIRVARKNEKLCGRMARYYESMTNKGEN